MGGIRAVRRNMLLTGIGAAAFLGELVFLKKMDLTLQQEVILFAATYMIIAAGVVEFFSQTAARRSNSSSIFFIMISISFISVSLSFTLILFVNTFLTFHRKGSAASMDFHFASLPPDIFLFFLI